MIKGLQSLIIEDNLASRSRLREALSQVVFKGRTDFAKTFGEALAILENQSSCDALFVPSSDARDNLAEFIDQVRELKGEKAPTLIVCLKSEHQEASYVASLYMLGVRGIVREPFSSDSLLGLLNTAREVSTEQVTKGVKVDALVTFLVGDAMRHIDAAAQNLALGRIGGYALRNLEATTKTIRELADQLHPDVYEQILINKFSNAKIPKLYKSRKRSTVSAKKLEHPGVKIREFMQQRGLTPERLKEIWKLDPAIFDQLIAESEKVTIEIARELARVLGRNPQYWISVQAEFDKAQAKK